MTTTYAPQSSPPTIPTRRHNGWLAGLSVVLLVVGLGVGFLVGRVTKPDTSLPSDIAGANVTQVLDNYVNAINDGDATTLASLLATDATFTDTAKDGGYTTEGNTEIASLLASLGSEGFQVSEPGTALMSPPGVAIEGGTYVVRYDKSSVGSAMAVYLVANGKIRHVWVVWP